MTPPQLPLFTEATTTRRAAFSGCRRWRYMLEITWAPAKPPMAVCMLNPSTADEEVNDPTIERCERRARAAGYGHLIVVNLFAIRSTDPALLYTMPAAEAVGADNDRWIAWAGRQASRGLILCGWGTHAAKVAPTRATTALALLQGGERRTYALAVNGDGSPKHPLYVGYDVQPIPYGVTP